MVTTILTFTFFVLGRAHASDFLVLNGAQQFGLGGHGEFADLVEEKRAAVGVFEVAYFILMSAGEGAADVAEEFAFDEIFRDRRAVADGEGTIRMGTQAVERMCAESLASTGLAGEKDGLEVRADTAHFRKHFKHERAAADNAFKAVGVEEFFVEGGPRPRRRQSLTRFPTLYWRRSMVMGLLR